MQKLFRLWGLVFVLVGSFILQPFTQVHAASIPAEINKQFTPLQIDAGGTSVLRISIFNPNTFPLTNVAFTDNLIRRQAGLFVDTPNGVVNTCGGTVTAVPGSTTVTLSGGGVPAQVGSTPGQCYIEINISSITAGNLINEIPAHDPGLGDIGLTADGVDAGTPVTVTNTTPANSTLTVISVDTPSMTKIFNPTTIFVGDVSLLTIRINNNDADTNLTGATFTDTLPTGLAVSIPANITRTNCGGSSSVTAPSGGTTITLSNAVITPALDCIVTLNVRGVTAGQYINRINAGPGGPGSLQTDQGVTNSGNVDGPLNVQPVGVIKSYSPTTIDAGDTTTLTITLQNPTAAVQTVTEVIDPLPANLTMVGLPATTCGGTVIYDSTPTASWELTGSTIPAGTAAVPGTCTITAVFQADLTASGNRTNTIAPNAIIGPIVGFTNYLGTSSTVTINPALSGTKAYAAPFAIALDGLNLVTITLNNNSSAAFTDVDFTDTLPTGLTVATTSTTPIAPADPTTTCTDGTAPDPSVTNALASVSLADGEIAANSNCTITFYVTSATPGSGTTYENIIPIGDITACTASLGCVGNNSNITTGTDLTVVNAPQLPVTVAKSFSAAVVAPGVPSRVRITITAPLDIAVSQISITDTLPAGVVVAPNVPPTPAPTESCPGGSVTAVPGSNTISYSNLVGNTLNAGASCNIDVYVVAADPGSYDNVIPSGTITTSQGRTNTFDSNTANLRVTGMSMSKAFYPTTVQANGISTLTITLENSTTYVLTNVTLNDPLPGSTTNGIIVAPTPNVVNTCGGTVTAVSGSQSITLANGTLPAQSGGVPGICTISVDVQGRDSSPGSQSTQTNTIPVVNVTGDIVTLGVTISPVAQAQAVLTIRNLTIGVVKGFDPVLVYGGGTSTMTVQLINPNSTPLTGVAFTDNMALISSGIILANPVDFDTGTCGGTLSGNPGDSSFSFSGGTIPANSSCSVTLSVVMNVNGNRTNRIPAGAVTTTSGVNSTQATEASLTNLPGVSVNKVFNPNPVQINQISNLTITITNTSSVPVVNMEVNDNLPGLLPAGLVIATPSNATTDCGGTLTADPNTQIISLDGGGLPGNGVCQIVVDVVSTEPGVYVNLIPAGGVTADSGVQNNDPASDSLTVGTLFSLGNRVWFDTNNNSLIGSGEVGVDGVLVQLYAADVSGQPTGAVLDTQTTAFGGYYRFDDLPEGDYVVVIPRDNFNDVGDPLAGYWSSGTSINGVGVLAETAAPDPDNDTDSEDNGTWQVAGAFSGAVISSAVTLGTNAVPVEPTNETDISVPNPSGEAANDRSNLTVDFGFYRTVIGDLIFVDFPSANGTFGGSDTALPGAIVQLFASDGVTEINVGADGIFGTDDDASGGVTTGSTGLYAFSGLPSGDYIVRVTPPVGYQSTIDTSNSSDNADPDFNINNNDNGIGILTGPVSSGILTMTAGETGTNITVTQSSGTTNDVTVDFGFTSISYSLGNRVWFDTDNSSTLNGTEVGVSGVRVELYDSLNALVSFDITDASGYYRFDGLNAGDYTVRIPSSEFVTGGPLVGYWSSGTTMAANGSLADSTANDPDTDTDDSDDNGITTFGVNAVNFVSAAAVTLGPGAAEPTNDNDPSTNPEAVEAPNNRSDRTVDFGFYRAELSNQIFTDVNRDGTYDAGDLPHSGAVVQLFASDGTTEINIGPDGIFGTADDASGGATTGAGGTYLFSGLPQGSYIVMVTPQAGFASTVDTFNAADTTTPNTNIDNNDNGVGIALGQVASNAVPLTPGSAGAANSNTVTDATGTTSNPTMDFGFTTPSYSLGNRVWFDTDNSSTINGAEVGVDGVQVDLYAADINGLPTGSALATQTTANGGYYRFDTLEPGDYVVVIPAAEFDAGGPLVGYWSSGTTLSGAGTTETASPDPDDDSDNDDNGDLQTSGTFDGAVISKSVTIGPGTVEPTNETDTDPTNPAGEATNDRSNLSVDFGFYRVELSNQIFVDIVEDGQYGPGDFVLPGTTVQLFASDGTTEINVGPDGIFGTTDDAAGGIITGPGGVYLFSGLPQGSYIVKATPPTGYSSIVDTAAPTDTTDPDVNTDDNDNGVGTTTGQVSSNVVTLTPGNASVNNTVDNASGTTLNPTLDFGFTASFTKTIVSTDAVHTTDPEVTIGEIITYQINMFIPVGTMNNVTLVDTPQTGLAFVDCIAITLPASVTSSTINSGACSANDGTTSGTSNPLVQSSGGMATFDFGTVVNSAASPQIVTVQYSLIVLDILANQDGDTLTNSAVWSWTGGTKTASAPAVEVVEPQMTIDKNATPTSAALGSVITFTIDIAHDLPNSTADAFDVIVTDQIPAGLEFIPGSITNSGTATLTSSNYNIATNTLTFVWDVFRLNETASVSFQATFVGPSPVVNSANVEWTSLLIDPQLPGPPPVPEQLSPYNTNATERWYDPAAPAGVNNYVVSDSATIVQQRLSASALPNTGFAPGVVTQLPQMPSDFAYAQTDLWLEIPQLKAKLNIVGVPFGEDSKDWDLKWLDGNAGWLDGTAFPTHDGNSALTAHSTLANGKPGPFANIGLLKYGDQIIVHLDGQKYIYEIRENKTVLPSSVSSVLKHEEYSWLTLITCKTYNERTGEYLQRTVVRAVLIKVVDE
jgi:LPXTG-site transpeptidase (sortase) family protein